MRIRIGLVGFCTVTAFALTGCNGPYTPQQPYNAPAVTASPETPEQIEMAITTVKVDCAGKGKLSALKAKTADGKAVKVIEELFDGARFQAKDDSTVTVDFKCGGKASKSQSYVAEDEPVGKPLQMVKFKFVTPTK